MAINEYAVYLFLSLPLSLSLSLFACTNSLHSIRN